MKKLILILFVLASCKKENASDPCESWNILVWYRPYSPTYNCTSEEYQGEMRLCEDDLKKYQPEVGKSVVEYDSYPYCQTMITFLSKK